MAFFLKGTSLSKLRLQPQIGDSSVLMRRGLHVEPGAREKALLAADPVLKHFKSHTKSVARLKRVGDVLTAVVVAGCFYEIYVRATTPKEQSGSA